jgi:L-asparagine oxygenase
MDKILTSNAIVDLTETDSTELKKMAYLIYADPSEEPVQFCKESKEWCHFLPIHIQKRLSSFIYSKGTSKTGFLLIRGCPEEIILPNTPPDNTHKIGETTRLARIQSLFMHVMGEMVAYEAEGYGRLFQDVVPTKQMATDQTSLGSHKELEIHTEQAFSHLKPDILSLACLRGDHAALTYILPVQSILENMDSKEIEMLRDPLWITGVDLSFKLNGNDFIEGDIRGPMAILSGTEEDPVLTFDQDLMRGITEDAEQLKRKIVDIYYRYRISHNLKPGEIIFIDNRRAVHGRSAFFPRYNGKDRFLIRSFATLDYEKTAYARAGAGRMIQAMYS